MEWYPLGNLDYESIEISKNLSNKNFLDEQNYYSSLSMFSFIDKNNTSMVISKLTFDFDIYAHLQS